jgi:biopolymer transport protein ExbD
MQAPIAMNITSLMDIMTILLVFMLKHFSGDALAAPNDAFSPAQSIEQNQNHAGRSTVAITRNMLLVDGEAILHLENGRIQSNSAKGESEAELESLLKMALQKSYNKKLELKSATQPDNVVVKRPLMVMADRATPFTTIATVLAAAQVAEFPGSELLVMARE